MTDRHRQTSIMTTLDSILREARQLRTTSEGQLADLRHQITQFNFSQGCFQSREDLEMCIKGLQDYLSRTSEASEELKILNSLKFATMPVRYSAITEAHSRTFRWIFSPNELPQNDPRSQIKFSSWLREQSGIFWVSGKPGSGKSTLMKYICDNEETESSLSQWAKPQKLITASFFFWLAGTMMQKSLNGLIQSLLYEILRACPSLAPTLCASRWNPSVINSRASDPWKLKELRQSFKRLKDARVNGVKFCFFIDGLDEYDGDHIELIQILEEIADCDYIKLCVSSRPLNCFERAFGVSFEKKLYLQDLTREDIALYAREKLGSYVRQAIAGAEAYRYQGLIREIVDRAQGVFLWVYLVVRSLRDGFINRDSMATLQMRLRSLPVDLEPFFKHILDSVDQVYQRRLAQMFEVALESQEPLRLLTYSFIDEEDEEFAIKLPYSDMSSGEKSRRQREMRWRLSGCTRGLLEVSRSDENRMDPYEDRSSDYVVNFLHRSVREFLVSKEIKKMLHANLDGKFCASSVIARGVLAEVKTNTALQPATSLMESMAILARKAEIQTGRSDTSLLQEMERCGQIRARRFLHPQDSFLQFVMKSNLVEFIHDTPTESALITTAPRPLLDLALQEYLQDAELAPDPSEMVRMLLRLHHDPNQPSGELTTFLNYIRTCPQAGQNHSKEWLRRLALLASNGADLQRGGHELILWIDTGDTLEVNLYHSCFNDALEILLKCGLDPNEIVQGSYKQRPSTLWHDFLARSVQISRFAISRGVLCRSFADFVLHGANLEESVRYLSKLSPTGICTASEIIAMFVANVDEAGYQLKEIDLLRSVIPRRLRGIDALTTLPLKQTSKTTQSEIQTAAPDISSNTETETHGAQCPTPKVPHSSFSSANNMNFSNVTEEPQSGNQTDDRGFSGDSQRFEASPSSQRQPKAYDTRKRFPHVPDPPPAPNCPAEFPPNINAYREQDGARQRTWTRDIHETMSGQSKHKDTRIRQRPVKRRSRRRDTVLPLLVLGAAAFSILK